MLDAVLEVLEGSVEVDTLLRLEAAVAMFSSEKQATAFVRGSTSRNVRFAVFSFAHVLLNRDY